MQFICLLVNIVILVAWIGPIGLIILVVVGIVGLIVYALKGLNKTDDFINEEFKKEKGLTSEGLYGYEKKISLLKNLPIALSEYNKTDDYIDSIINIELASENGLTSEGAYSIAKKAGLLKNLPIVLYEDKIKGKFISLFKKRFKKQNKCNLYSSENVSLEFKLSKHPIDVRTVKNSINEIVCKLQGDFWLYNICMEWTGDSTPLTLLQLPQYIELENKNRISALQEYLYSMLDKCEYCLVDVDVLLDKMGYTRKDEKSLHLHIVRAIINGLNKLRVRTVPFVDIDNKRLNFGDKCIIYKIKGNSKVDRTETYSRLELFVRLVVRLIQVDGCNGSDIILVEKYIDSQGETYGNIRHLKAYFLWLLNKKQSIDKKNKDSIGKLLNNEQCAQFARMLVKLSCNLGDVNNNRVSVLTKILPLLGEDANNIHSQIHRMLMSDEDFATVEVTTNAKEYVIVQSESQFAQKQKVVKIDAVKLSKLEAQTESAQNMLSEIFNEEETVMSAITPNQSPMITILTKLLTKTEWSKVEVENICKEFNVITGSVLEQINDYAYDKVDDVVIEDDDNIIFVNIDYKDQLI